MKAGCCWAFEFAVFSDRFKFFVSSGDDHFMTSSRLRDGGVVPSRREDHSAATRPRPRSITPTAAARECFCQGGQGAAT
jgi:hypothetical protein